MSVLLSAEMTAALEVASRRVHFADAEVLRHKGAFSPDMMLITDGAVDCDLGGDTHLTLLPGTVVGERGFLTGQPANATLRAKGPVSALSFNSVALAEIQNDAPAIAAQILRHLATILSEREEQNEELLAELEQSGPAQFEIIRCSTLDRLRSAQRLRYDVYCVEFGRTSPHADADDGTLSDALDISGTSFLALEHGRAIGTARVNLCRDGAMGILPQLYGLDTSGFAPDDSAIITRYAIRDSHRGGFTYLRLFSAIGSLVYSSDVNAIFIDCVPKLSRFFAKVGFERAAPDFVHYENGLSVPMVLDLEAYFDRLPFEERLRRDHPF